METPICISIIMHSIILIFSFIICIFYKKNDYFRFGPHKDLTLININVDTQNVYIAAIIVLTFLRFTRIMVKRLGYLYIDSVMIDDRTKIKKVVTISTMMNYVMSMSFIVIIKAFITQFDLAILSVVFSEAMFIPFYYYYIQNTLKTEIPERIIDITNINPLFTIPKLSFENMYDDNENQDKKN